MVFSFLATLLTIKPKPIKTKQAHEAQYQQLRKCEKSMHQGKSKRKMPDHKNHNRGQQLEQYPANTLPENDISSLNRSCKKPF